MSGAAFPIHLWAMLPFLLCCMKLNYKHNCIEFKKNWRSHERIEQQNAGVPVPIIMEAMQLVSQERSLERIEENIVDVTVPPQMLNIVGGRGRRGALQPVPQESSINESSSRVSTCQCQRWRSLCFESAAIHALRNRLPCPQCWRQCRPRRRRRGEKAQQVAARTMAVMTPCWTRPSVKPESCWPSHWQSWRCRTKSCADNATCFRCGG